MTRQAVSAGQVVEVCGPGIDLGTGRQDASGNAQCAQRAPLGTTRFLNGKDSIVCDSASVGGYLNSDTCCIYLYYSVDGLLAVAASAETIS